MPEDRMPEDPIRRALDLLDRPAAPSADFADALFERLLTETELRPARRRSRVPRPTRGRPELRRAITIAAAIALSIAVFALVLGPFRRLGGNGPAGSGPLDASTPFTAIVQGHVVNPLVDGSVAYDEGEGDFRFRLDYRAPDSWRMTALGGSMVGSPLTNENVVAPGDSVLRDGATLYESSAAEGTVSTRDAAEGFSPLNLLGSTDPSSPWAAPCAAAGAQTLADETVAGRTAHHLVCPTNGSFGDRVDLWVDVETQLILRIASHVPDAGAEPPTPVPGPIKFSPGETIELTDLVYDPTFPADTFAIPTGPSGPAGATGPTSVCNDQRCLSLGEPVPTWTAPLLGGGTLDLASLRGAPTALYLWATWCDPCLTEGAFDAFDAEAGALGGSANLVAIATQDDPAAVRAYVSDHGYSVPVATDGDGAILRGLKLVGIPALVLLDAEGNLAGVYVGDLSGQDMTAILDAFAAGERLPDVGGATAELIP